MTCLSENGELGDVTQWQSICLACGRSWVPFSVLNKTKQKQAHKMGKEEKRNKVGERVRDKKGREEEKERIEKERSGKERKKKARQEGKKEIVTVSC